MVVFPFLKKGQANCSWVRTFAFRSFPPKLVQAQGEQSVIRKEKFKQIDYTWLLQDNRIFNIHLKHNQTDCIHVFVHHPKNTVKQSTPKLKHIRQMGSGSPRIG